MFSQLRQNLLKEISKTENLGKLAEDLEVDLNTLQGLVGEPVELDTVEIGIQTRLPQKRKKRKSHASDYLLLFFEQLSHFNFEN